MRPRYRWQLRSLALELGERTLIMGVVNVTPDSFSDGGSFSIRKRAIEHALRLLDEGADIVDIGGESTRPGAQVADAGTGAKAAAVVSEEEELQRVLPVIQGVLRERPGAVVSVDTYKSGVARAAAAGGAKIVNDVSAFQWDPQMAGACAELQCGVVLMHTRGQPHQWRALAAEEDVTSLVEHDLANRVQVAFEAECHATILCSIPVSASARTSRKIIPCWRTSISCTAWDFRCWPAPRASHSSDVPWANAPAEMRPPNERLYGSLAAMVASILKGAHIVRVHDVKPAVEAAAVADAVLAAEDA